jgi:hypothetical protein
MALESFKAQISLLLEEMINQPEDEHEVQEQLREKLKCAPQPPCRPIWSRWKSASTTISTPPETEPQNRAIIPVKSPRT